MSYYRYQPYESEHFWHVEDTENRDDEKRFLVAHYPKTAWGEVACESHCKRMNRTNFDIAVAVEGQEPGKFLQELWYDENGHRRREV